MLDQLQLCFVTFFLAIIRLSDMLPSCCGQFSVLPPTGHSRLPFCSWNGFTAGISVVLFCLIQPEAAESNTSLVILRARKPVTVPAQPMIGMDFNWLEVLPSQAPMVLTAELC